MALIQLSNNVPMISCNDLTVKGWQAGKKKIPTFSFQPFTPLMDRHKQRSGKRKQAPLQHNLPIFLFPQGSNSLTSTNRQIWTIYFYSVSFVFELMRNVFIFATLRKCIRPKVSLQVGIILLHSVHECIKVAC